jgi:hypothetical protein
MSFGRTLLLSVLAWSLLPTSAVAQTPRYKFTQGEKLRYDLTQSNTIKVNAAGMQVEVKLAVTMDVGWEVLEIHRRTGVIKLALKVENFRLDLSAPGMVTTIDLAEPKSDREKALKAALNEGIKLELHDTGELVDIDATARVISAIQTLDSANGGSAADAKMLARYFLQPFWLTFPARKLANGQSWMVLQNTSTLKDFGALKQEGHYTYEDEATVDGKKLERMDYRMVIKLDPDPKGTMQAKINRQQSKGHVLFDAAAGRLVEGNVTQSFDLELVDNMGQPATLSIIQTTSYKARSPKMDSAN